MKLKPCPFCGAEAKFLLPSDEFYCVACDLTVHRMIWNTRTPSSSAEKVIKAAIALEKHKGYLATRGTKEKSDLFDAVIEYQKETP